MQEVAVGKIVKAQGLLGELKVFSYFDDTKTFCVLKNIRLAREKDYRLIEKVRVQGDFAYIKLEGVNDRLQADTCKYQELFITREELAKAFGTDELVLEQDVIGYIVICDGKSIGKIIEIENFGAGDILTIEGEEKTLMVPLIDDLVEETDTNNKQVFVNSKRFNEMAVSQDED